MFRLVMISTLLAGSAAAVPVAMAPSDGSAAQAYRERIHALANRPQADQQESSRPRLLRRRGDQDRPRPDLGLARYLANPKLAPSNWPVYHANRRATASSAALGPGAVSQAEMVRGLTSRRIRPPAVSPWTMIGERYDDGSQPVFTTPADGVGKYIIANGKLEAVDFIDLDRGMFDFDWGMVILEGRLAVVTEQARDRITIIGDAEPGNPHSKLAVKKRITIPEKQYGELAAHISLAPSGHLLALTETGNLLAIDLQRGRVAAVFSSAEEAGYAYHNSFPIDDGGRIYLAAQRQVAAIDWDGRAFKLAWTADYDMRGPGCEDTPVNPSQLSQFRAVSRGETCTGSGTTPTLIGTRENGVFVLVDGHSPRNNLIAFWRDEPPADWQPLDDPTGRSAKLDRRIAGVFPLPYSTPDGAGFTAENSPAVLGSGILVAQWSGFSPKRDSLTGVQRVDWKPRERRFELAWSNPDVMFNGVPLIACKSDGRDCHTYGMGRYGDAYHYVSLDWNTGRESGRVDLGTDDGVLDQGNGNIVADDGSIVLHGKHRLLRIR